MIRVTVAAAGHAYDACIETGLIDAAGSHLRSIVSGNVFVITVPPVRHRWGKRLLRSLTAAGFTAKLLDMPDGERAKKLSTIARLAEKLVRSGADRKSVIIALGGGVVGDVAGFLAAVYMRGVDVVQVPTTVLAQVDASIGGKTGVNLRSGKNLLGAFHHPRAVLIDPAVLTTLPNREFRAGLYESVKCGVIGNPELFRYFEDDKQKILSRDATLLEYIISESVRFKARVVSADEREGGERRILNFGHTIGHALEAETGYRFLLHGEAVAWGMLAATNIAQLMGKLDSVTRNRIADAIIGFGKLPRVRFRSEKILARLQADKKTVGGVVHFILPTSVGSAEVVNNIPEKVILEALAELHRIPAS